MLLTTPYLELLLTRRFIITVLIITGFAKISAKFINSETEAIPPTEIELTASMERVWELDKKFDQEILQKPASSTCGRI